MKAIAFRNTKVEHDLLSPRLIETYGHGYAYETSDHFIYFFGSSEGFYGINGNMVITEGKNGTLLEWVDRIFGATDITEMKLEVGKTVDSVWQPCLFFPDIMQQAICIKTSEMRSAQQSLRLLVSQLDDILLYIEPEREGLKAYSHKTRQLLLLACTEVENSWKYYMKKAGVTSSGRYFNTTDYVLLAEKLYLKRYKLKMKMYSEVPDISPFSNWDSTKPTASIPWYDAYNKTKHDRDSHFSEASLWNCIQAVCANVVMYCARFSPFHMFDQGDSLSSLVNQHFRVEFGNVSTSEYYLYKIDLPPTHSRYFDGFGAYDLKLIQPFEVEPFRL